MRVKPSWSITVRAPPRLPTVNDAVSRLLAGTRRVGALATEPALESLEPHAPRTHAALTATTLATATILCLVSLSPCICSHPFRSELMPRRRLGAFCGPFRAPCGRSPNHVKGAQRTARDTQTRGYAVRRERRRRRFECAPGPRPRGSRRCAPAGRASAAEQPRRVRRTGPTARRRVGAENGDRTRAPAFDGPVRTTGLGQDDTRADPRGELAGRF